MGTLALGMGVAILAFVWWRRVSHPVREASGEARMTEVVLSAMPKLLERWQEGDREGHYQKKGWSCGPLPQSPHVAPGFLRCQPRYLECWARGEAGVEKFLSVPLGDKTWRVKLKAFSDGRFGRWVTRETLGRADMPLSGLLVDVEVEGLGHWPMILEDTCRDTYLPERVYSYGPRAERGASFHEMTWDNVGRKIFVDKYLVTHADVELWKDKPVSDLSKLALPVTDLSVAEQEAYCASRGARRMEAMLWDAATMTPADLKRALPEFVVKPWLPWTRDRKGTFFEEALRNKDFTPTKANCRQAYVAGCEKKIPYQPHHSDNVAWSGVFHVLGGESERFRNPVEPSLVMRASSRKLAANDDNHQLGRRLASEQPGAFRCYREVFP